MTCYRYYWQLSYITEISVVHLLTWINFNPSMDNYIHYEGWDEIIYSVPNFNSAVI